MSYVCKTFAQNGCDEKYEFGKVAKQADGSVLLTEGDTVVLAAVAVEPEPVEEDFLPLTVQYLEKSYAAGKIPGGFFKRETKPGDFETLTSRIIDRSLRPLFPKGFNYPVVISVTVLSCGEGADLQRLGLNAASAALFTSTLPVDLCVTGVRVGKIEGELKVNPSLEDLASSSLDMFVAGTGEQLLMIEMKANGTTNLEVTEPVMVDAIMEPMSGVQTISSYNVNEMDEAELVEVLKLAGSVINENTTAYQADFKAAAKEKKAYTLATEVSDETVYKYIKSNFEAKIKAATNQLAKTERSDALKLIRNEILATDEAVSGEWDKELVDLLVGKIKKEIVRKQILEEKVRADGRALNEVRPISIETNILPRAHSSVLFTRGQTQALAVLTLGSDQDRQAHESLTSSGTQYENLMLHYNFPGFSVGEAKPSRAPGRRELGHGNLAKRAVECTINPDFDMSIRIVSEILESNGSSSMATVCASSLALKAADVPTEKLIAGVAMGLVVEGDKHAVLTDIMGLEDHDGDMDFKVAGSREGITALQMDIKLGGINYQILEEALEQAKEARLHILGLMEKAESEIVLNTGALPSSISFEVDASKIVDIIGQAGKTIREIIEKFDVSIDLDRERGGVKVQGSDKSKVDGAVDHIKNIVENSKGRAGKPQPNKACDYEKGQVLDGNVEKVLKFGALVKLPDGNTGMVHISKLANRRVDSVESVVSEGEAVKVQFIEQGKDGKISLAMEGVSI